MIDLFGYAPGRVPYEPEPNVSTWTHETYSIPVNKQWPDKIKSKYRIRKANHILHRRLYVIKAR